MLRITRQPDQRLTIDELAPRIARQEGDDEAYAAARHNVLQACEATIERLAADHRYFAKPTRTLFTDIRAGEGTTAVLMLINIFVLLICYSVIKTVREPLILLGGGAEVRSYASADSTTFLRTRCASLGCSSR